MATSKRLRVSTIVCMKTLEGFCDPNYFTSISSSCVHSIKSFAMATYSNCFNKGRTGNHKQIPNT